MSKITPRVVCTASQLARPSDGLLAQTVERREGPEGLERSGAICRLGPPRGLVGRGRAPDDELPVARPCELVGELADPLRREVGERRRQLLVVLVLEPRERSEEHTSELQSHSDLVCRLLLEKKKKR